MDRALSDGFKRRKRIKLVIVVGITLLLAVVAFMAMRRMIGQKIDRAAVTIEEVGTGPLEATIPASGIVVPENEFLITSPINAKIEKVLHRAGDAVGVGESILELNKETTQNNYDKLLDAQEVNRNKISQLKLSIERSLNDLHTQYSIKEMRIKGLETDLSHEQSLLKIGGGTPEKVKQAGVNLDIAKLELSQLKSQISNQERTMQADMKSLGFEISIQGKTINETSRKLDQAQVRSPAKGIITWVSDKIGSDINEGSELVKIADLSSYKVDATISDSYASQLKVGGAVIVRIDDMSLKGSIVNIEPAVENGLVKFLIGLEKNSHPLLRSNLKAEVFIVTSIKDRVLRIRNGQAFTGAAQQKVFVVSGDKAISKTITTGESNFDFIEIKSGLKAGEKVIVSDMQEYAGIDQLELK